MLLPGQTYDTSCPYFWSHCGRFQCDGCQADAGQGKPSATPPWAEGTSIEERHELARRAVDAQDDSLAKELSGDAWSWRRHILGTSKRPGES